MLMRFFVLVAFALLSATASSHLLKIDRDIGVLVHVDPNDAPVAREKAALFIEIKDRSNRFAPERCDCRLAISAQGKQIFSDKIFTQGRQSSGSFFLFPEAGMYRLDVVGTPLDGTSFQAFRIPFDIRVEPNESSQGSGESPLTRYWPVWMVLLLAVIAFIFAVLSRKKRGRP